MNGMNRYSGNNLGLNHHISQSIQDILTTPVGSRVMQREYGSLLPRLVDKPSNDEVIMQLMAATVIALARWETRINLTGIDITTIDTQGKLDIVIDAVIKETEETVQFNIKYGEIDD